MAIRDRSLRLVVSSSSSLTPPRLSRDAIQQHLDQLQVLALHNPQFLRQLLSVTAAMARRALADAPETA